MPKPEVQLSAPAEQLADDGSALKRRPAAVLPPENSKDSLWESDAVNVDTMTESPESGESGTRTVTPAPKLAVRFAVGSGDGKDPSRRRSFPRVPTPHPREFAELIRQEQTADENGEGNEDGDSQ